MGMLVSHPEHLQTNTNEGDYCKPGIPYPRAEARKNRDECLTRMAVMGGMGVINLTSIIYLMRGTIPNPIAQKFLPFTAGFIAYDLSFIMMPRIIEMNNSRLVFDKRANAPLFTPQRDYDFWESR